MKTSQRLSVRKNESEFRRNGSILVKSLKKVGESLVPSKYCAICGPVSQCVPIYDGYCAYHIQSIIYNN